MQPTTPLAFVRSFFSSWLTGMSGPLSVPFAIAAVFVPSHAAKIGLSATALVCFWSAAFGVWVRERTARNAAEATLMRERPYISIYGISFRHTQGARPPRIAYNVSNIGTLAPAIVDNVSVRCGVEHADKFPPLIIIADHLLLQTPILAAGQERSGIEHLVENYILQYDPPLRRLIDRVVFQVVVSYHGPLTKGHEAAQCWQFNRSLNGFHEVDDPRYTYTR
jgi:hypothetical protein